MTSSPHLPAAEGGLTPAEVESLRAQTPAVEHIAHFAHGAASLPSAVVYAAWDEWQQAERTQGAVRALARFEPALRDVRDLAARLLGADPRHIAFSDSAGHAWSTAMAAVLALERKVHVISSADEYGSNSLCLLAASSRLGLTVVDTRDADTPLLRRLADALDAVPAGTLPVVSLPLVATSHGVATDLDGVATLVHQRGGLLLLDASHAVGQIPVDVRALGCDVLVFPTRKWLRGPKGGAVLYVSDRGLARLGTPSGIDVAGAQWTARDAFRMVEDARRFEGNEYHPGLRLAIGAACREALRIGIGRIARHNAEVRARLTGALRDRFGWTPLEGAHRRATALITYALPAGSGDGQALVRRLWEEGINISAIGLQYARWALEPAGVPAVLRLTPHYLTSDEEIERLARALDR